MNKILKLIGWAWTFVFAAFVLVTIYKYGGQKLPDSVELYRASFQGGLKWFLSSGVFGVVFILMWVGVSFYLSSSSGWKDLSKTLSDKDISFVEPLSFTMGSGKIGKILHNGMLRVSFSASGIVLKVVFPFRIGHRPLYIPWSDVEAIEILKTRMTKNGLLRRLAENVSPFKYARIRLSGFPDQLILVGWKEAFRKDVPSEIMR